MILLDTFGFLTALLLRFANALPNIIAAIVVAFVGWFVAKSISKLISTVLAKTGIDQVADKLNEIDVVNKFNVDIKISTVLAKVVYYVLMLIFFMAATELLGMPAVSQLMVDIVNYIPVAISAMILLVIGVLIAEFFKNIVLTACTSLGIPSAKMIANFVFYFIFITAIISALGQAKINTAFITTNLNIILAGGVFAFALGYGIASKDMMANFLASFYSRDKFKIGDSITIDGSKGIIIEMDSTSLTLLSPDHRKIIIPLHKLSTGNVEIHNEQKSLPEEINIVD